MTGHKTQLKGFRLKGGKVEKIPGYGLSVSAKLKERGSKRVKVVKPVRRDT